MHRARVAAALLAAAILAVPTPAQARPGIAYQHYLGAIQQPVEQETDWPFPEDHALWVVNPTGCAWDVDDNWQDLAYGTLNAGVTLSVDECMVASQNPYWMTVYGITNWWTSATPHLGVEVKAATPALVVRTCYPQRCFTATQVLESGRYVYRLCTGLAYNLGDPALSVIPGSQGGVGAVTTATVTVRNPTGRAFKDVSADVAVVGVAQGGGSGCKTGRPSVTDYPFTWSH